MVANKSSLACWPLVLVTSVYSEPELEFTNVPYVNSSSSGLNFISILADSVCWPAEFRLVQYMVIWSDEFAVSLFLIILRSLIFLGMVDNSRIKGLMSRLSLFSYISDTLFFITVELR